MAKPVIIDCDPGHDDAIALLLALGSEKLDVKGITTVAGNQTGDKTINNALRVLSYLDIHKEVAKGATKPLIRELITAAEVHGESGLEGPELPEPSFEKSDKSAIELMFKIINESKEKVTLIPTGPLTNIANLLLAYPSVKDNIEEIVLMGGACFGGNWTPAAEFNILVDPEAADIVYRSGLPVTMCGLDVTHKAQVFGDEAERIRSIGNKASKLVAELLDYFGIFHMNPNFGFDGPPLHDVCAVAYVIDPSIFITKKHNVEIDISGELTVGATVVDYYDTSGKEKNVNVVFDLDRERFIDMLYDNLKKYN
ncbi:pyrimidine-specific ribonucleoside hydrolase RihA [Vallitalea sp.]|jgi:pyrimidine-specific ribonucleoside hydrolase|uniref:pyrimidine-specific ribonucleoside hydrolase RihA n=1 Tax=Vallitalea sp. TaxID=1882829 RepID=UPI0025DE97AC|nr:pyrimidine-specific ribonucleoside hydrolase RihA [Vallitalea sp.]MCT4688572.1 pyrimidine-specific ribonucleoside hydrolase RihA [Vallitalea sp.]